MEAGQVSDLAFDCDELASLNNQQTIIDRGPTSQMQSATAMEPRHRPAGRFSIVLRLTLFVAIVLMLAGSSMSWVGYLVARNIVQNQIHDRLRVATADRYQMLLAFVERQQERVALVASRTLLRRLIEQHGSGDLDDKGLQSGVSPILNDARQTIAGFEDIWICNETGKTIAATHPSILGKSFAAREEFQQGLKRPYVGRPEVVDGKYVILLSTPVRTNDGRFLGVLLVRLNAYGLNALLSNNNGLGDSGEVLIGHKEGERIHYLLPTRVKQETTVSETHVPLMVKAIGGEEGFEIAEYDGEPSLVRYRPIAYQPNDFRQWGLVGRISIAEAYQPLYRLQRILFAWNGLLMLAGLIAAYFVARQVTRPILNLTATAKTIASGDLSARVVVGTQDEVGDLAAAFNHMSERLAGLYATLEDRVSQRTRELQSEIREHEQTQVELRSAKNDADSANHAKSEFLANMSHEIRTPMNAIMGMTDLVLDTSLTPSQREYLKIVQEASESLLSLINDILDYSKIEAGKLELEQVPFALRDRLGDALKTLGYRAHSKGLELACHIHPDVPDALLGDPSRLRQVVINLVGNAIKFTRQGEVVLEVSVDSATQEEAVLHFSVKDTGIGIDQSKLQQIFLPFEQADSSTTRKYGGTGLGLAICTRIVGLMGDRLWAESQPGSGSKFQFKARFPLASEQAIEARQIDPLFVHNCKVLIVDDNSTNRRILDEMLRSWGMETSTASSAKAAFELLYHAQREQQPFRLVIADVQMPEVDGFTLARQINLDPKLRNTVVIMLSSGAHPGDLPRSKDLGIAVQLLKPVKQSELFDAIVESLGTSASEEPPAAVEPDLDALHPLQVLLAEDSIVNQKLAVALLQKRGHHVVVANNGIEAVEAVRTRKFDVVLMDVQMPEMDGFEATAVIRAQEKKNGGHLPILAMTAHAMKGDRELCLQAGMDDYIAKPIRANELFTTLDRLRGSLPFPVKPQHAAPADSTGIDFAAALVHADGDHALLRELLQLFLTESPSLLESLKQAIPAGDGRLLKRAAHTLRGTLTTVGASDLADIAARLEQMGDDNNFSAAKDIATELGQELTAIHGKLRAYLDQHVTPMAGK